MGTLKNITQQRGIPIPSGLPNLVYVPYSFGSMKPLHVTPHNITLTIAPQSYADVFIPANTWGQLKRLIVTIGIKIQIQLPNAPGGPSYSEQYIAGGAGPAPRLAPSAPLTAPSFTQWEIHREFRRLGSNIFEVNYNGIPSFNSASNPDGINHVLQITGFAGTFDFTIDNTLSFQLATNFAGSFDTADVIVGTAYIQSPLDLNRLPR